MTRHVNSGVWNRPFRQELLGVVISLGVVGIVSLFTGGFVWMASVVLAAEAIWLVTRTLRNSWRSPLSDS